LQISLATLDRVIASGKLKAKKHGHATVVMRREIERNIEDRPDVKTLALRSWRGRRAISVPSRMTHSRPQIDASVCPLAGHRNLAS
jgi:hypothetical protein